MAHECPECYQTCYCHGDIDDIIFDGTEEQNKCDHCPDDEFIDNDDDYSVYEGVYGEEMVRFEKEKPVIQDEAPERKV